MSDHTPTHDADDGATHQAGAFDIRVFIAALIGIYGVVLVLTSLVSSDGRSINLFAGIGMVVVAGCFVTWARLRPVVVPEHVEDDQPPAGH